MQNFDPNPQDTLSAQEARAVMEAITQRQQASGANLDGRSVETLSSGLGVSEEEIRRILEDIRIQRRSEQLAAGILQHEQKHRKRLDVTAAIGAAIAIVMVVIAVGAFLYFRRGPDSIADVQLPGPMQSGPLTPTPAPPPQIHVQGDDGSKIDIDERGIHITHPDGTKTTVKDEVRAQLEAERASLEGRRAALEAEAAQSKLSAEQAIEKRAVEKAIEKLESKIDGLDEGPNER